MKWRYTVRQTLIGAFLFIAAVGASVAAANACTTYTGPAYKVGILTCHDSFQLCVINGQASVGQTFTACGG